MARPMLRFLLSLGDRLGCIEGQSGVHKESFKEAFGVAAVNIEPDESGLRDLAINARPSVSRVAEKLAMARGGDAK